MTAGQEHKYSSRIRTTGKPKINHKGLLTRGDADQGIETKDEGNDSGTQGNAQRAWGEVGEGRVTGNPGKDLV